MNHINQGWPGGKGVSVSKQLWEIEKPPPSPLLQAPELSQLPLLPLLLLPPPRPPLLPQPVCSTPPSLNILPTHHTSLFSLSPHLVNKWATFAVTISLPPAHSSARMICLLLANASFSPITSDYLIAKLNYSQAVIEPHSTRPPGHCSYCPLRLECPSGLHLTM